MKTTNLSSKERANIAQSEGVKKFINRFLEKRDDDVKRGVGLARLATKLKERRQKQLKDEELT